MSDGMLGTWFFAAMSGGLAVGCAVADHPILAGFNFFAFVLNTLNFIRVVAR